MPGITPVWLAGFQRPAGQHLAENGLLPVQTPCALDSTVFPLPAAVSSLIRPYRVSRGEAYACLSVVVQTARLRADSVQNSEGMIDERPLLA